MGHVIIAVAEVRYFIWVSMAAVVLSMTLEAIAQRTDAPCTDGNQNQIPPSIGDSPCGPFF